MICGYDVYIFCFFKQKTAYEMRISDWSSDVCSSDLARSGRHARGALAVLRGGEACRDAVLWGGRSLTRLPAPRPVIIPTMGRSMPAFSRRSLFGAAAAVSLMPVLGLPRGSEIGRAHV